MPGSFGSLSKENKRKLEERWKTLKNKEDELYGRQSKTNLKLLEEKQIVEHFKENTIRDIDGRFIVQLPVKRTLS